jgi:hypothetical protein
MMLIVGLPNLNDVAGQSAEGAGRVANKPGLKEALAGNEEIGSCCYVYEAPGVFPSLNLHHLLRSLT